MKKEQEEERPPILGKWSNLYIAVLSIHLLLILAFTYFTYAYN